MTYPKYATPNIVGITMASGKGSQLPIYNGVLSYLKDAQAYANAIGAELVNAMNAPATGYTFVGINKTDGAQPWMVTWDSISYFFAGIAIYRRAQVSGSWTVEGPGAYIKQPSGSWDWVNAPTPTPAPVPAPNNSGDAAAFAAAQGVPTNTLDTLGAKLDRIIAHFNIP
jgi:hypothetical protein